MNKMRRDINILRRTAMAIIAIAFLLLFAIAPTTSVYASGHSYDSWVREKTGGYNTTSVISEAAPARTIDTVNGAQFVMKGTKGKPGVVQRKISEVVVYLGIEIFRALESGKIDASANGIIMGHITSGSGTSVFVFDLMANNVYGIAGALLYTIFRTLALVYLFILTLWRVIRAMFLGEMEAYRAMKDDIAGAVVVFLLLYLMPQMVDWVCTARNATSIYLYDNIVSQGLYDPTATTETTTVTQTQNVMGTSAQVEVSTALPGLPGTYYKVWEASPSLPNGIMFFMIAAVIPLVFIFNYLKIAVIQIVLFGSFPVFALLSLNDRGLLAKWMAIFFSNIFVPVIDLSIILLPTLVIKRIDIAGLEDGFLKACIIVALFVSLIPARNQLLNMLGNGFGVKPGSIGGALALGAAAIGGIKAAAGGIGEAVGGAAGIAEGATARDEANTRMEDFLSNLDNNPSGSFADKDKAESETSADRNEDGSLKDVDNAPEANGDKKAEDYLNDDDKGGASQSMDDEIQQEYDQAPEMDMGDDEGPTVTVTSGAESPESDAEGGNGDNSTPGEAVVKGENSPADLEDFAVPQGMVDNAGSVDEDKVASRTEMNDAIKAPADLGDFAVSQGITGNGGSIDEDKVASRTEMNDAIKGVIRKDIEASGAAATAAAGIAKGEEVIKGALDRKADPMATRAADVKSASRKMDGKDIKGGGEPGRYENWNTKRLSNLEQLGIHQESMKSLDQSILREQNASREINTKLSATRQHLRELNDSKVSKGAYAKNHEILMREQKKYEEQLLTHEANISKYSEARVGIQSNIDRCRGIESEFAAIASEKGIPGAQTFKDAKSFADNLKVAERMRERASYKNFKTEGIKGYLTPEDRMRFERSENIRKIAKEIGQVGAVAAGSAVTAGIVMAASATGSEENMEQAADTMAKILIPGAKGKKG